MNGRYLLVLPVLFLAGGLPAQVLHLEKVHDLPGRRALEKRLVSIRVELDLKGASPSDLARALNLQLGTKELFLVDPRLSSRHPGIPPLTLHWKKAPLLSLLSFLERTTDLRFLYRGGLVWITHKEDLKEAMVLRAYDVRAAVLVLHDFPGPRLGIPMEGQEGTREEEKPGRTVSGFDLEGLVDLIRTNVEPDSWDSGKGASIRATAGGILLIRQTVRAHAAIRKLLASIGILPFPAPERRPAAHIPLEPRLRKPKRGQPGKKTHKPPSPPARRRI